MIVLLAACADDLTHPGNPDRLRIEGDPLARVSVPLFGGTVAQDGAWVAASDVDGDRVVLRAFSDERHVVTLPDGWVPGPLAFGADGVLHVLLRGKGALLSVDPGDHAPGGAGPELVSLLPVCEAPRGLAVGADRVWVACEGGELVGVGARDVVEHVLERDLRDVVLLPDGRALVSVFRTAEILVVDLDAGSIVHRYFPTASEDSSTPRVARRMVPWADQALLVYQEHFAGEVSVTREGGYSDSDHTGGGTIVDTVIAVVGPSGSGEPHPFEVAMATDALAIGGLDDDGLPIELRVAGELRGLRGVYVSDDVANVFDLETTTGFVTGLSDGPLGRWYATREPFALVEVGSSEELPPRGSGFVGFHQAPQGIACASCHPEGADDGHTWLFDGIGVRRTQALGGGLLATAPFHWDGDLRDMHALYTEVGMGRMGQPAPWGDQVDQLAAFVDGLPVAARGPRPDPDDADLGEALFGEWCASCHAPPAYTSSGSYDVGTGRRFQVPSLRGVAARLPVMHDGCAATLAARFDPSCGGGLLHGGADFADHEVRALVAFLETL